MRFLGLAVLALVACGGGGNAATGDLGSAGHLDGGTDAADLALPSRLCTSTACAASRCAAGCTFAAPPAVPCVATVAVDAVRQCAHFCGLFTDVRSPGSVFGCWYYDTSDPACLTCGYHGSCFRSDEGDVDYRFGGAICASREACGSGGPLQDAGVACDMTGPTDGGGAG